MILLIIWGIVSPILFSYVGYKAHKNIWFARSPADTLLDTIENMPVYKLGRCSIEDKFFTTIRKYYIPVVYLLNGKIKLLGEVKNNYVEFNYAIHVDDAPIPLNGRQRKRVKYLIQKHAGNFIDSEETSKLLEEEC